MLNLKSVEINNFKKIASVELPLSSINVLVGVNGSGKSSIIQGLHLACCCLRQADRVRKDKSSVIPVEELDYLPSDSYNELGHGEKWGNKEDSAKSQFKLTFIKDDTTGGAEALVAVDSTIQSARNRGISVKGTIPNEVSDSFRKNSFTAYIPGLSGIPNNEEMRSERVVKRASSFGDSNVFLRNILLIIKHKGKLNDVEKFVSEVLAPRQISIDVSCDEKKDLTISCKVAIDGINYPVELVGTGYLQLIQIFSYIFLFEPKLLLIDEPDNHLHPSAQERLLPVLNEAAEQNKFKVILTTHSPFIIRNAPLTSKIFWFSDGVLQTSDRSALEFALGWGAFGKKIIIYTEDSQIQYLKAILRQREELLLSTTIIPGGGTKSLPSCSQAEKVYDALGGKFKIFCYRDRDAMTSEEVEKLKNRYASDKLSYFVSKYTDIESYFCSVEMIKEILQCDNEKANHIFDEAVNELKNEAKGVFMKRREAVRKELYQGGGSPVDEDLWSEMSQLEPICYLKGKFLLNKICNKMSKGRNKHISSEFVIDNYNPANEIAKDMLDDIAKLL